MDRSYARNKKTNDQGFIHQHPYYRYLKGGGGSIAGQVRSLLKSRGDRADTHRAPSRKYLPLQGRFKEILFP